MSSAPDARGKTYTVKAGDTLYSIALENGLDYKEVASWNQLADVNLIKIEQVLRLTDPNEAATPDGARERDTPDGVVIKPLKPEGTGSLPTPLPAPLPPPPKVDAPVAIASVAYPKALKLSYGADAATVARQAEGPLQSPAAVKPADIKPLDKPKPEADSKHEAKVDPKPADNKVLNPATGEEEINWAWPTVGKLVSGFSDASKGLDIGGKQGQPVVAAGSGKIVYAGSGLRGYGKLVIIKHNKTYLSAYAHNSQLLVKEGDNVKKGDKIAEMGNTDAEQVKLHFEIRRFGKPVDPSKYLTAG
ncbi:peptidoglycan DD-metalloendopeptidase family protein [Chitinimonas arctica]